jgi:ATP/maltotriose-dependent transcriptional regulator MalT
MRHLAARLLESFIRGEWAQTVTLANENLLLAKQLNLLWFEAFNLHYLGWTAYCQQSYAEAARFGERSVALFQQMGYPIWSTEALIILAYELAALGETTRAATLLDEALNLSKAGSDTRDQARALCGLGWLALRRGDLWRARTYYEESVRLITQAPHIEMRHRSIPAACLEGLAEIAVEEGQVVWAARLLGAAHAQRTFVPYLTPVGLEQSFVKRTQALAQADLEADDFERAFTEGAHLTLLQVLIATMPLERLSSSHQAASESSGETHTEPKEALIETSLKQPEPLTKREQEVLKLLADGLTNAEIAAHMVLSVVTVNSYLRSIYSKLGVSSRTRAVRYAYDANLLA